MSRLVDPGMEPVVLEAPTPATPLKAPRSLSDHIVLGFDCEWDGRPEIKGSPLLSAQFAGYSKDRDGKQVLVSALYDPPGPRFTQDQLGHYVFRFIREKKIPIPPTKRGKRRTIDVVLIAHLAQAEISMIDRHFEELVIQPVGNKAHHARLQNDVKVGNYTLRIRIVDLWAFFKTGLGVVGESVGLEKLDDGIDRERLVELLAADKQRFEAYAIRDAEIALVAFERFRQSVRESYGIDVLSKYTLPAVAADIFLRNYLSQEPVPSRDQVTVRTRSTATGYEDVIVRNRVYDGLADPRKQRRLDCCSAYKGAWAEAYVHGFWDGPVEEWDVRSLYPSSAIAQPLPNAMTKWFMVTNGERRLDDVEGFGRVRFEFPVGTLYPCLGVTSPNVKRMVHPLRGECFCTVAEVRRALEMGAVLHEVNLHVFHPTESEVDHDVARYMRDFLERKNLLKKGTLEYEVAKLCLNALVGKFAERPNIDFLVNEERKALQRGWTGFGQAMASSLALRDVLRGDLRVGRLFIPEWATLILGRARALMVDFVLKGALLVSTDSVVVPAGTNMNCQSLEALRSVQSDMAIEAEADAAVIFRTRLYALLVRVENLRQRQDGRKPIATDDKWAVMKMARHGVPVDKEDCAKAVLASLKAGSPVAIGAKKTTLLGAVAAIRGGVNINHCRVDFREPQFNWDCKRSLVERSVNPWQTFSTTRPYASIARLEEAERRPLVKAERCRLEKRSAAKAKHDHVITMLGQRCYSVRDIAKATGVSKSTVQRLKTSMRWAEMESYQEEKRVRPVNLPEGEKPNREQTPLTTDSGVVLSSSPTPEVDGCKTQ